MVATIALFLLIGVCLVLDKALSYEAPPKEKKQSITDKVIEFVHSLIFRPDSPSHV